MTQLVNSYRSYKAALQLLYRDLETLFEYVEPCDANLAVFSHRIYELYLRACTEFEALCKDVLGLSNGNIKDYEAVQQKLDVARYSAALNLWQPGSKHLSPFAAWQANPAEPLTWYRDYNSVKHNRNAEFAKANLGNMILAVTAVHCLFRAAYGLGNTNLTVHLDGEVHYEVQDTDIPYYTRYRL